MRAADSSSSFKKCSLIPFIVIFECRFVVAVEKFALIVLAVLAVVSHILTVALTFVLHPVGERFKASVGRLRRIFMSSVSARILLVLFLLIPLLLLFLPLH